MNPCLKRRKLFSHDGAQSRQPPQTSPANSDDKGSDGDNDNVNARGLIFWGDSDSSNS